MWKVAIAHFGLCVSPVVFAIIHLPRVSNQVLYSDYYYLAFVHFFLPQTLVYEFLYNHINQVTAHWIGFNSMWLARDWFNKVGTIAIFVLMPIWSICFSWIYVKCVNWLNRFPVLGFPIEPVRWISKLSNWTVHHPVLGKRVF